MVEDTYTVSQAAGLVNASPNTIRTYSKDYKQFLSEGASPGHGQERRFRDEDIAVMVTIKTLKSQRRPAEVIIGALLEGERYEPGEQPPEAPPSTKKAETTELATIDMLERFVVRYESQIDNLEGRLEAERVARVGAEIDAARAAGQLEAIYRRHWWQVWRPERPGE